MLSVSYLQEYLTGLFVNIGCSFADAQVVTQSILEAELRGLDAYGVVYVERYYELIRAKRINLKPEMRVLYQTPSTATLEADAVLWRQNAEWK